MRQNMPEASETDTFDEILISCFHPEMRRGFTDHSFRQDQEKTDFFNMGRIDKIFCN